MAKVITRYFDTATQAFSVRHEMLHHKRFSIKIVHLFDSPDGLVDALTAANVEADTAQAYYKRMANGGAVLLVQAGHKPLAVAQTTRELTAAMGAVDLGDLVEEVYIPDPKPEKTSILSDHPLMMTKDKDPYKDDHHMANWPIPLIVRRKPFSEMVIEPHGRMADFPLPLISRRKPYTGSIVSRHGRMASFPIPLISRRKPFTGSIISRHGRMANFPISLISRRKPYTGSLFPRHQRMANWPWPHLINGKTGTNSLMPNAPRMANFPISLLSQRKPYDKTAISRHGRMANFPISLLSKRKPFTGSVFSAHARMANFLLPLVVKDSAKNGSRKGLTMSGLFGLPTLIRR